MGSSRSSAVHRSGGVALADTPVGGARRRPGRL